MKEAWKRSTTKIGVVRYSIRTVLGVLVSAPILFLPAGRWDWIWGWIFLGIMLVWSVACLWIMLVKSPELILERAGPQKGAKRWDTILMSVIGLSTWAKLLVAGFDVRNAWSAGITIPWQVAAAVIAALGYALGVWALYENAFFSQIVRIQKERRQTVATGGPYRIVRHPAYFGTILFELASPVMLGSWWAFIPGGLSASLFILRTALEDRALQQELEGYTGYARQVRYRLIPGVW